VGSAGKVISVHINGSLSDSYKTFHGSVKIKAPGKRGRTSEYKWGGTACPAKDLTDHQVDLLVQAFHHRKTTQVVPRTKNGQGGVKCLVGFELRRPRGGPGPS
jgi:hypothetical protein